MENWLKYCLSILVLCSAIFVVRQSDSLSNETFHHLDPNERRKLSAKYLALGKSIEMGSPKSMRLLEKAARINPDNELVWMELSWPYLYTGQYHQWHYYMDKAIKLNPKEWQGNRGYTKLKFFRDYGGALYDLIAHDTIKSEISYSGKIYATNYLKGLCYLGLKNYDEAKVSFKTYLDNETKKTGTSEIDQTAYLYLGIIENYYQNYEQALKELQPAFELSYPHADIYYQAAYAHFMLGHIQQANEDIIQAEAYFTQDQYNRDRVTEVMFQLYEKQILKLKEEISCFL